MSYIYQCGWDAGHMKFTSQVYSIFSLIVPILDLGRMFEKRTTILCPFLVVMLFFHNDAFNSASHIGAMFETFKSGGNLVTEK